MRIFFIILMVIIISGCNVNSGAGDNSANDSSAEESPFTSENSIIAGPTNGADYISSPVEGIGLYFDNMSSIPGTEEMLPNQDDYDALHAFPYTLRNIGSYSIVSMRVNFDVVEVDGVFPDQEGTIGWQSPDYFSPGAICEHRLYVNSYSEITKLTITDVLILTSAFDEITGFPIGEISLTPIEPIEFTFD